jgi:zinc protease
MRFLFHALAMLAAGAGGMAVVPASAQSSSTPPATAEHYALDDSLPPDRSVIIGRLPNGLTYYIKHVEKPARRVELRLVVRAGSNQEDDDQRGLAHMVEHMQFNGSPHFPNKGDLIQYFQSIGMTFGADLNAFTTFDQTVYEIRIPTDSISEVERGFDVLQDWAGQANLYL